MIRSSYLIVFILALLLSCEKSAPSQNTSKNTSQNSNSQQNASLANSENTQKWSKEGICLTPNQVKAHGGNNCIVVKWKCPRCESNIEDLRWTVCKSCCRELEICIVCNKKIKD